MKAGTINAESASVIRALKPFQRFSQQQALPEVGQDSGDTLASPIAVFVTV